MGEIDNYPESPSLSCSSAKPRGISTRNETKRKPPGVETKRNETHRGLLRLVSHPKRNTEQLQCTPRETKRNKIITHNNIKFTVQSSFEIPYDFYNDFIDHCYETMSSQVAKYSINSMIGSFNLNPIKNLHCGK